MQQLTCFCPALSLWELIELVPFEQLAPAVAVQPAAWSFDAALLFVDISGFTNMCTKLSVDCLQSHINRYFSLLIEVIVRSHGDVLRFAGDAVLCAWCVAERSELATRTQCVQAACACALELLDKCGTYPIPELPDTALSIHLGIGVSNVHAFRVGVPQRWEVLVYGEALKQVCPGRTRPFPPMEMAAAKGTDGGQSHPHPDPTPPTPHTTSHPHPILTHTRPHPHHIPPTPRPDPTHTPHHIPSTPLPQLELDPRISLRDRCEIAA